MYYITWQFSCFNTEIRVFDYFYIIIFLKLIQTANRRQPYGRRRLLLSLIFSSFPCFSKKSFPYFGGFSKPAYLFFWRRPLAK